jgi:hypothetical protein
MFEDDVFETFAEADYHVDAESGRFTIRVGEPCGPLDAMLDARGLEAWAYLTAYNPGGQRSDQENERAQQELRRDLDAQGFASLEGAGASRDETWSEPSVLVLGMSRDDACTLGAKFGQWAIVVGCRGGAAELVDLRAYSPR